MSTHPPLPFKFVNKRCLPTVLQIFDRKKEICSNLKMALCTRRLRNYSKYGINPKSAKQKLQQMTFVTLSFYGNKA